MNPTPPTLAEITPEKRREMLTELLKTRMARSSLSFTQERLWFMHQLSPDSSVYNVPAVVRLSGPLDVAALEHSLNEIVARHEVLRTTFDRVKDGPIPVVREKLEVPVEIEDLGATPAAEREAVALERANQAARLPFDLECGPMVRALLLRLGSDDHLLVLTFHHITAEGWSVALLFGELERLYPAFLAGDASPLQPLPIQYADYARWLRGRTQDELLEHELAYWQKQLSGELPVLELPSDRARPSVPTLAGAWESRVLSPGLQRSATKLARKHGATLFMVLLAAFQALLQRYTGQTDILVGTPIAGRNLADSEQLIGVFINTLVLRTDLSGDPTFDKILGRVRETAVDAFSHQEIPFERVVEKLRPDRDVSHTPIFQVMFALQNTPPPALKLAGLEPAVALDPSRVHNGSTKVDLALFAEDTGDGLQLGCEYSSDLFDRETIRRLLGHYEVLLTSAVDDPGCRLSRLDLLAEPERQQLLADWNDTASPLPSYPVHELFEQQAARRPDATAVLFGDTTVSYTELDQQANRLARFLVECGVKPEDRVGICLERSTELLAALIAVLKTGASYLPLDPALPSRRLAFILADAGCRQVLTQQSLLGALPETSAGIICVDRDRTSWSAQSARPLRLPVYPGQLAYVIYTSGSTGTPKGTGISHRAVVRLAHQPSYANFSPEDVSLLLAPTAFDASTFETWTPLLNGISVAVYPPEKPSLTELAGFMKRHRITTAFLTTALFHQVADHYPEALDGLQQALAGGDVLDPARASTALKHLQKGILINAYGPTENTTFTCCHAIGGPEDIGSTVSIGKPIRNTRVYVLDPQMAPVPIGVPGELYIGGDGLARGYLGRPGLTAECFLPDPFSANPGDRLYRSGDRVRYRADGRIDFLGREDFQVKVRGFRIELEEIQSVLLDSQAVRDCVVMARDDMGEDKRIVAYIVPTHIDASPDALRKLLAEKLPEYMVPSVFVILDELPTSPNGKIDRNALAAPSSRPMTEDSYVAPGNSSESVIAEIWRQVLAVDRVGRTDNFFDLGGHSLLLIQAHSLLRERFDTDLTLVDMFRYPTVASLAQRIPAST